MTPEQRRDRIAKLFDRAVDLPAIERSGFLDAECENEPELRGEVEQLLAHHEPSGTSDLRDQIEIPTDTAATPSQHSEPESPSPTLDRYRIDSVSVPGYKIVREINRGGQGVVYQAVQETTKRIVALKFMHEGATATAPHRARFEREIGVLGRLKHPNIVTIYESGVSRGHNYFAMEHVRGLPLNEYLADNERTLEQRLHLFSSICGAVSYAHQQGVVHRDLKPGNILVDADGQPHILDFGLAKVAVTELLDGAAPLTVTSEFMGTLAFAAPEQARGDPAGVDTRTDVYALGVILFQMLTGDFPYPVSGELSTVLRHIAAHEPRKPSEIRSELSRDMDTVVLRALAKDKERRYQSVAGFRQDVEHILAGEPVAARRDSVTYLLNRRSRQFAQKHPIVAILAAMCIGFFGARTVGVALLFNWTTVDAWYQRLLSVRFAPSAAARFETVRIVALTDECDVEALARSEGLEDVSAANWRSVRRLHGRLMEKLARALPRVVAWDVMFPHSDDAVQYDHDFVRGVRALREAGADVVVGVGSWWFDGPPDLSRVIAPEVRWGGLMAHTGSDEPWRLELIAGRGSELLESLALAAYASLLHPGVRPSIDLDEEGESLTLLFRDEQRRPLGNPVHVRLYAARRQPAADPEFGLRPKDTVGYELLDVPSDAVLKSARVPYRDVLAADDQQLGAWFRGKAVIVGDYRTLEDRHDHPDGRRLWGCDAHAVGLDRLVRGESVWLPRQPLYRSVIIGGTLVGLVLGAFAARQPSRRILLWTVLVAALFFAGVGVYRQWSLVFNPLLVAVAALLTGELVAWVMRVRRAAR